MESTKTNKDVVSYGLDMAKIQHDSDILNVIISIGLLTASETGSDKKYFDSRSKLMARVTQLTPDRRAYDVCIGTNNSPIFDAEVTSTGVIAHTFVRGSWEHLLEGLSKEKHNVKEISEPKKIRRRPEGKREEGQRKPSRAKRKVKD